MTFLLFERIWSGDKVTLLVCLGIWSEKTWNSYILTVFSVDLDISGNFDLIIDCFNVYVGSVFCLDSLGIYYLSVDLLSRSWWGLSFPDDKNLDSLEKPKNSTLKWNISKEDPAIRLK